MHQTPDPGGAGIYWLFSLFFFFLILDQNYNLIKIICLPYLGKVNCTNDGVQNLGNPSDVTNQSTDSATNQNKEPVLSSNQGEELDPSTNQRPDLTDKPANQNEGCPKSVIESGKKLDVN